MIVSGREETAPPVRVRRSYIVDWFRHYWLGVWFAIVSGLWLYTVSRTGTLSDDLYIQATRRWLAGGDPWTAPYGQSYFAAPPPTLLVMLPFAVLPFGQALSVLVAVACGIATIRILELPWYWLLFPPLVNSMVLGGIDAWLIPLIFLGHGWLAVLAKVYAAVPLALLGRWKPLAVAGAVMVVTAPLLPWGSYLAQFSAISGHLREQAADLSAPLVLAPVAVLSLILMGRKRAAWLAVPALWPSTQFYYGTLAMPGLTPLAAAVMVIPSQWSVLAACVVLAVQVRTGRSSPGRG